MEWELLLEFVGHSVPGLFVAEPVPQVACQSPGSSAALVFVGLPCIISSDLQNPRVVFDEPRILRPAFGVVGDEPVKCRPVAHPGRVCESRESEEMDPLFSAGERVELSLGSFEKRRSGCEISRQQFDLGAIQVRDCDVSRSIQLSLALTVLAISTSRLLDVPLESRDLSQAVQTIGLEPPISGGLTLLEYLLEKSRCPLVVAPTHGDPGESVLRLDDAVVITGIVGVGLGLDELLLRFVEVPEDVLRPTPFGCSLEKDGFFAGLFRPPSRLPGGLHDRIRLSGLASASRDADPRPCDEAFATGSLGTFSKFVESFEDRFGLGAEKDVVPGEFDAVLEAAGVVVGQIEYIDQLPAAFEDLFAFFELLPFLESFRLLQQRFEGSFVFAGAAPMVRPAGGGLIEAIRVHFFE